MAAHRLSGLCAAIILTPLRILPHKTNAVVLF